MRASENCPAQRDEGVTVIAGGVDGDGVGKAEGAFDGRNIVGSAAGLAGAGDGGDDSGWGDAADFVVALVGDEEVAGGIEEDVGGYVQTGGGGVGIFRGVSREAGAGDELKTAGRGETAMRWECSSAKYRDPSGAYVAAEGQSRGLDVAGMLGAKKACRLLPATVVMRP